MGLGRRLKTALFGEPAPAEPKAGSPVPTSDSDAPRGAAPPSGTVGDAREVLADLEATVIRLSESKLAPGDLDPNGHMFDFGYVDSLSAVNLLGHIEERYGVSVPDVELVGRLSSLQALADHICREMQQGGPA